MAKRQTNQKTPSVTVIDPAACNEQLDRIAAAAEATALAAPRFERLPIDRVIPTPDNPRTVVCNDTAFAELTASIKAVGVQVPVLVRPHADRAGCYDLRAGARRMAAAKAAGLATIPALVYDALDDDAAFDLTVFENCNRADLSPLEQARAAAMMLEHYHGNLDVVADKFDKSASWVKRRAYVNENLIERWKQAVSDPDPENYLNRMTISHLELIARFDAGLQAELLEVCKDFYEEITLEQIQDWCGDMMRVLAEAKWPDDAVFAGDDGAPLLPCRQCPKRSDRMPLLWDCHDAGGDGMARCLDAFCWEQKQRRFLTAELERKQAAYPTLKPAVLNCDYSTRRDLQERMGPVVELDHTTTTAKKTDPKASPYLVVGGPSAGSVVWRKPKYDGVEPKTDAPKSRTKTLDDKRAELDRKRHCSAIKALQVKLNAAAYTDLIYADEGLALLALVSQFGAAGGWGNLERSTEEVAKMVNEPQVERIYKRVWELVKPKLNEQLAYQGPITQLPDAKIAAARGIAHLIEADYDALLAAACEAMPEPKSWKK